MELTVPWDEQQQMEELPVFLQPQNSLKSSLHPPNLWQVHACPQMQPLQINSLCPLSGVQDSQETSAGMFPNPCSKGLQDAASCTV